MDQVVLNEYFSTQEEEIDENNHHSENSREIMLSLRGAFQNGLFSYKMYSECRQEYVLEKQFKTTEMEKDMLYIIADYMHSLFKVHAYVNKATYAWYVHHYQNSPNFINYAIELPKIKHQILEAEVDWYIENITKDLEMVAKENCPSLFQPVAEQDPREACHTRAVINHALEHLESIATKMTPANTQDYTKKIERYTWCLTGMVPLLPVQEQDPLNNMAFINAGRKHAKKFNRSPFDLFLAPFMISLSYQQVYLNDFLFVYISLIHFYLFFSYFAKIIPFF
ncbi:unnamed protein product [Paramecium octaurelia]|uniref:Uncharacterized protein n=1 Tax=Paramecium octaurelia TaxID=43137 RepID=A0A8S1WJB0_PAROT|nr:unnamed protein product [Paramecium octaurelia]